MAQLQLRLLGGFRVSWPDGTEIVVASKKGQALIAYLSLQLNRSVPRSELATLLWGNRFDEQARGSLRQCLFEVRKCLAEKADTILESEGEQVGLKADAVSVDVAEFERLASQDSREALTQAAEMYAGEFLQGFELRDESFAEWLEQERTRLQRLAADVLERCAELNRENGDIDQALGFARRLLAFDPLRESAHRLVMRLYSEKGQRNEALRHYRDCVALLRENLDVEPEAETTALYQSISQGRDKAKDDPPANTGTTHVEAHKTAAPSSRRRWLAAGIAAILILAIAAGYAVWDRLSAPDLALPLPDRPSIAVLPFANLSGDPEQEYFSDGITADIITELSRVPDLFVIARHSVFTYKGKSMKVQRISAELGVRYVVEGSVQKSGGRIRVTAQLANALTGHQIWAQRFERDLEDLFALQDDVTQKIVAALEVTVSDDWTRRALHKDTTNLRAYDYLLRGRDMLFRVDRSSNQKAREMYLRAIELDPRYAKAHAYLAWTYLNDWRLGWVLDPQQTLVRAYEAAQKAISLSDSSPDAHSALGDVYLWSRQHDRAVAELRRSLALNPNSASTYATFGDILTWSGKHEEALDNLAKAVRLNPHYPYVYHWYLGHAYFAMGDYKKAVGELQRLRDRKNDFLPAYLYLAASYALLGRAADAKAQLAKAIELNNLLSAQVLQILLPYKDPADLQRVLAALQQSGLPSEPGQ